MSVRAMMSRALQTGVAYSVQFISAETAGEEGGDWREVDVLLEAGAATTNPIYRAAFNRSTRGSSLWSLQSG
jgi:hypothetical protein